MGIDKWALTLGLGMGVVASQALAAISVPGYEGEIKTQIEATYRLFKEKKLLSFSCECEYNCFYRSKTGAPKNTKDTFVFLEGQKIPLRSLHSKNLVNVLREKI